jgi:tetratricopeptide (TPR) repeat protein
MEGSGVADASWLSNSGYLLVRGICDYANARKGDLWQGYAAVAAAGVTRAILERFPGGTAASPQPIVPISSKIKTPTASASQLAQSQGDQSPAISATGDVTVTYGPTDEQVKKLVANLVADMARADAAIARHELGELQQLLGLTRGAALALLHAIRQHDVPIPIEQLPQKLMEAAADYQRTRNRITALDSEDAETRALAHRAHAAIEAGLFDEANQLLDEAAQADLIAATEARSRARQAQAQVDQCLLRAANVKGTQGSLAMTQLRYLEAAQYFQEGAELMPTNHPGDKGRLLFDQAHALLQQGEERGDRDALTKAIAACRLALQEYPRERAPLDWAMAQDHLGVVLATLGQQEEGTARLEEAVAAYRQALKERQRERVPRDWAATQNNLGIALASLSEREGGTAKVLEAVAAFRGAVAEYTLERERMAVLWARAQSNLGSALQLIGEQEVGTAQLEEAVTAFRQALNEWKRERVPLLWATAQNNLGSALSRLGEREEGTTRLEEAVAACRAALEEWRYERVPLDWAEAKKNLGDALRILGERESGTTRLEEAVAAYHEALKVRTREQLPREWAATRKNLGFALLKLSEREMGTARLEEAVAAFCDVIEASKLIEASPDLTAAEQGLSRARRALGEHQKGP